MWVWKCVGVGVSRLPYSYTYSYTRILWPFRDLRVKKQWKLVSTRCSRVDVGGLTKRMGTKSKGLRVKGEE